MGSCRRNKRHSHGSCDDCYPPTRQELLLLVMATQTFVTTDMQAINTGIQVQQSSGQVGSQTTKTTSAQQATIIQSAHNSGQQFIVTISGDAGNEQVSEAVQQIQGTLQYQQQYVDQGSSSDSSLFAATNGQMQSYGDYPSQ